MRELRLQRRDPAAVAGGVHHRQGLGLANPNPNPNPNPNQVACITIKPHAQAEALLWEVR